MSFNEEILINLFFKSSCYICVLLYYTHAASFPYVWFVFRCKYSCFSDWTSFLLFVFLLKSFLFLVVGRIITDEAADSTVHTRTNMLPSYGDSVMLLFTVHFGMQSVWRKSKEFLRYSLEANVKSVQFTWLLWWNDEVRTGSFSLNPAAIFKLVFVVSAHPDPAASWAGSCSAWWLASSPVLQPCSLTSPSTSRTPPRTTSTATKVG